jgi:hypothetical protein
MAGLVIDTIGVDVVLSVVLILLDSDFVIHIKRKRLSD